MNGLASPDYVRQRLEPRPGDLSYLHLSDLLLAVNVLIPKRVARVLDFGCGGAPPRPLFGVCTHHRADFGGGAEDLDFLYGLYWLLPWPSACYNCVLSAQLLANRGWPPACL